MKLQIDEEEGRRSETEGEGDETTFSNICFEVCVCFYSFNGREM